MTKQSADNEPQNTDSEAAVPTTQPFYLTEYGITVEAHNIEEANKIAADMQVVASKEN